LNYGIVGFVGAVENGVGCGSGAVEGDRAEFPGGEGGACRLIEVGFIAGLYQGDDLVGVVDGFPYSSLLGVGVVDGGEYGGEAR
jgi:hypothetical protein